MALYDLAFPDPTRPARAQVLCAALDMEPGQVPRLRDSWAELVDGEVQIALYTRVGGGNRPGYDQQIQALRAHPGYRSDRDDGFDATYATFRFRVDPAKLEELAPNFAKLAHPGEVDTDARWREAIARVESGDVTPGQVAGFDQLVAALRDTLESGGGAVRV